MNVQSISNTLGKWGCLCFCDIYLAGGNPFDVFTKFNDLLENRIILEDAFVLDHEGLIYFVTGKKCRYVRSDKPPKDDRLYIANYKLNGANHYVVCKSGEIVFNSLDSSTCVNQGFQDRDYRWIE